MAVDEIAAVAVEAAEVAAEIFALLRLVFEVDLIVFEQLVKAVGKPAPPLVGAEA